MLAHFDPDSPATEGLFGLPSTRLDARVVVIPVPFEATTSSGQGTASGPDAVLQASYQVDLCSPSTGDHWRHGIALADAPVEVVRVAAEALADARRVRDEALPTAERQAARERVNAASRAVEGAVHRATARLFDQGQIPGILGGDHSVPLGAITAATARYPGLGILHVDAHADLRVAYEGFEQSHASILHNVLEIEGLGPVVQVGIRDFGTRERSRFLSDSQITTWTDEALSDALGAGTPWLDLVREILAPLPDTVWVTFDVDGLEPSLCPGTGTPVPGGLSWNQARQLLLALLRSGRRVVGFDLCEVADGAWDATVGARLLYLLAGISVASHLEGSP